MTDRTKCQACRDGAKFELPITMAFQPILNVRTGQMFAYEALLRGVDGTGAGAILSQVTDANRYAFDQTCRVTAIELATELDLAREDSYLSINFLPNAVYEPRACIKLTLETAMRTGFPVERIMFEFTESERVDSAHLLNILHAYRNLGFKTAIDDFGAGYAGLDLLAKFQPDIVKLDMELIRDIDQSSVKRTILRHSLNMLSDLGIEVVCEGVETQAEFDVLCDLGVELMQGYLFAKPEVRALPVPVWANRSSRQDVDDTPSHLDLADELAT
jgi:EAL domain-containing protein (putative c-di-GMP-specific phosphodiesterase class I)